MQNVQKYYLCMMQMQYFYTLFRNIYRINTWVLNERNTKYMRNSYEKLHLIIQMECMKNVVKMARIRVIGFTQDY